MLDVLPAVQRYHIRAVVSVPLSHNQRLPSRCRCHCPRLRQKAVGFAEAVVRGSNLNWEVTQGPGVPGVETMPV